MGTFPFIRLHLAAARSVKPALLLLLLLCELVGVHSAWPASGAWPDGHCLTVRMFVLTDSQSRKARSNT